MGRHFSGHVGPFFILLKESLIVFSLSRLWRWTAAPRFPQVASLLTPSLGPVPALPFLSTKLFTKGNLLPAHTTSHPATFALTTVPSHPRPMGTQLKVHRILGCPSITYAPGFPIPRSHCRCGPLSVTMYTNPLIALVSHRRCGGALGCNGNTCRIPAGVAISGVIHPISVSSSSTPFSIDSTTLRSSGRCLPYTDAVHLILFLSIGPSKSLIPHSACTSVALLPLYAPTTQPRRYYTRLERVR